MITKEAAYRLLELANALAIKSYMMGLHNGDGNGEIAIQQSNEAREKFEEYLAAVTIQ